MDYSKFIKDNILGIQKKEITPITKGKINYISNYVNTWSEIGCVSSKVNNINFIDCMCNAGIYNDTTLGTSMRVLEIFVKKAKKHPTKKFNLFLNDYDSKKIEVIKKLAKIIDKENNVNIIVDNEDVNDYLTNFDKKYGCEYLGFGNFTILFVDPYNFGTVNIKLLHDFSEKHYSELIFNYFSSDYLRNINNSYAMPKIENIKKSMCEVPGFNENMSEMDVLELLQNYFKTTRIKYSFAYPFRTKTNVPLYYILYSTPSVKGLEKIKESFWEIFDGNPYFLNYDDNNLENTQQLKLFNDQDINEMLYKKEAQKKLIQNFKLKTISYDDIVIYLLENSMLRKGQIIKDVIKPLIDLNIIKKMNNVGANNYTGDSYYIGDDIGE